MSFGEPITRPERMSSRFCDGRPISCCSAKVKWPRLPQGLRALPTAGLPAQVPGMTNPSRGCSAAGCPARARPPGRRAGADCGGPRVPLPDPGATSPVPDDRARGERRRDQSAQLGIAHYLEHLLLVGRNEGFGEASASSSPTARQRLDQQPRHRLHPQLPGVRATRRSGLTVCSSSMPAPDRLLDHAGGCEIRERNVVRQEHDWRYASSPTAATWMEVSRFPLRGPCLRRLDHRPAGDDRGLHRGMRRRNFLRRWYRKGQRLVHRHGADRAEIVKAAAEKASGRARRRAAAGPAWLDAKLDPKPMSREFRRADRRIATPSISVNRLVRAPEMDRIRSQAAWR